jgi:hypothetical protein
MAYGNRYHKTFKCWKCCGIENLTFSVFFFFLMHLFALFTSL